MGSGEWKGMAGCFQEIVMAETIGRQGWLIELRTDLQKALALYAVVIRRDAGRCEADVEELGRLKRAATEEIGLVLHRMATVLSELSGRNAA